MTTFKSAIIICIEDKYASFKGRASRSEFWYFNLFCTLFVILAHFLDLLIFGNASGILKGIASLATAVPALSVSVRRLHDLNKSGWWLAFLALPLSMVTSSSQIPALPLYAKQIVFILALIIFIVIFCKKSDPRPNKFGSLTS